VIPEYRGRGIDGLMYDWIWTHGVKKGLQLGARAAGSSRTNAAHEQRRPLSARVQPYNTYRVYDKAL